MKRGEIKATALKTCRIQLNYDAANCNRPQDTLFIQLTFTASRLNTKYTSTFQPLLYSQFYLIKTHFLYRYFYKEFVKVIMFIYTNLGELLQFLIYNNDEGLILKRFRFYIYISLKCLIPHNVSPGITKCLIVKVTLLHS